MPLKLVRLFPVERCARCTAMLLHTCVSNTSFYWRETDLSQVTDKHYLILVGSFPIYLTNKIVRQDVT